MYISQQLKNNSYKMKQHRRVSSIMIQMKYLDFESAPKGYETWWLGPQKPPQFRKQISLTLYENNRNPNKSAHRRQRNSLNGNMRQKQSTMTNRIFSPQVRNQNKNLRRNFSDFIVPKAQKMSSSSKSKDIYGKNKKMQSIFNRVESKKKQLWKKLPEKNPSEELETENIHDFKNFLQGGYNNENQQFSDVLHLKDIDNCRRKFKLFDSVYEGVSSHNSKNKMTLKDVKGQNLRDIVFVNEQKKIGNSYEFLSTLQKFNIMK